jgi:hypothetical protein
VNPSEDIKHTIGHFAPGMVANPELVPRCPRDVYLADRCSPESLIGSSEADIDVLPPTGTIQTEHGRIYNIVQQGTEAGRLGIVIDAAGGAKAFLEAAFFVRTKTDYGLDGDLDNLPRTLFGLANIQIRRLKFTLRHRAGPPLHARADVVHAQGLDRRRRGLRPPGLRVEPAGLVHAHRLRQAPVRAHVRDVCG